MSRSEPWRGNQKRVKRLGWLASVFLRATPPVSVRTSSSPTNAPHPTPLLPDVLKEVLSRQHTQCSLVILVCARGTVTTPEDLALARDGSQIIAASSFLAPVSEGRRDPNAGNAFEDVCDAFCSGARLYFPMPRSGGQSKFLSLFELWRSEGTEVPHLALDEKQKESVSAQLRDSFSRFATSDLKRLAEWLAFQFTPECEYQYLGGGNDPKGVVDYLEFVDPTLLRPSGVHYQRLAEALPASLPGRFEKAAFGRAPAQFGLAYAFEAYAKSASYAIGLAEHDARPVYYPHWLRKSAIEGLESGPKPPPGVELPLFPWGMILRRFLDNEHPHVTRSPERACRILKRLRRFSRRRENHWVLSTNVPAGDTDQFRSIVQDLARFKEKGLAYAGVVGKSKDVPYAGVVDDIVKGYSEGKVGRQVVRQVTLALDAYPLRRWTLKLGTRFGAGRLFRPLDDGVVEEYLRRKREHGDSEDQETSVQ